MIRVLVAVGLLLSTSAYADITGPITIPGMKITGTVGGGVAPVNSCTAGAIDLSLSTGCNLPFYVGGIFP
jgi:hypothetical protein